MRSLFPVLDVVGVPYTEGSLQPMINKVTGRAFNRHQQDFELKRWRNKLAVAMAEQWRGPMIAEPCFLLADFRTPIPGGPTHANDKDVDKLLRAVLDALKMGRAVKDDRHLALIAGVKHHVGAAYPVPGARLEFGLIGDAYDALASFIERNKDSLPQSYAGQPAKSARPRR